MTTVPVWLIPLPLILLPLLAEPINIKLTFSSIVTITMIVVTAATVGGIELVLLLLIKVLLLFTTQVLTLNCCQCFFTITAVLSVLHDYNYHQYYLLKSVF